MNNNLNNQGNNSFPNKESSGPNPNPFGVDMIKPGEVAPTPTPEPIGPTPMAPIPESPQIPNITPTGESAPTVTSSPEPVLGVQEPSSIPTGEPKSALGVQAPDPMPIPEVTPMPAPSPAPMPTQNPIPQQPVTKSPENTINNASSPIHTPNNPFTKSPIPNNPIDEALLKAFVGRNYDKIKIQPFNLPAFFFTSFYMFYRKMFGYGILLFIVNIVLSAIFKNMYPSLVINAGCGLLMNKIYLQYANNKIAIIKGKFLHTENFEILRTECTKKGGTSVGKVFLGLITEFGIVLVIVIATILMGLSSIFSDIFKNLDIKGGTIQSNPNGEIDKDNQDNNTNKYNGVLVNDTSIKIGEKFNITVPGIFEAGMFNSDTKYNYEFSSNEGVFDDCTFSLTSVKGFTSGEELVKSMKEYYYNYSPTDIEVVTINGLTWHSYSQTNSFGKKYYYATTKDNNVYMFEYEIDKEADETCDSYRLPVLGSITAK